MIKLTVFAGLLIISQIANSAIYKSVDENGNTIYSDKPGSNSEAVKLGPVTTYKSPKYRPLSSSRDEETEGSLKYSSFKITSPEADQSFWETTGSIKIAAEADPALQIDFGHQIQFYMDGYKQGKPSGSANISLINVNRGAHSVYATIIDENGKVVQQSDTIKFTLHKPSVNNPARQQGQRTPPINNPNPQ